MKAKGWEADVSMQFCLREKQRQNRSHSLLGWKLGYVNPWVLYSSVVFYLSSTLVALKTDTQQPNTTLAPALSIVGAGSDASPNCVATTKLLKKFLGMQPVIQPCPRQNTALSRHPLCSSLHCHRRVGRRFLSTNHPTLTQTPTCGGGLSCTESLAFKSEFG